MYQVLIDQWQTVSITQTKSGGRIPLGTMKPDILVGEMVHFFDGILFMKSIYEELMVAHFWL